MKISPKTSAQFVFLLAVSLTAAAQKATANRNHQDQPPSAVSAAASADSAQMKSLQARLANYHEQLRLESERVEDARQQAISAGIVGDGAGPFIEVYWQEQARLEALQARLAPQIDQTKKLIAELNGKGSSNVASAGSGPAFGAQSPAATQATEQPRVLRASRGN